MKTKTEMTETETETRRWVDVGSPDQIGEGQAKTFEVEGERIAIARANGQLYAVQDVCTHDDGPLGDGSVEGYAIVCPRHGAKFDVRTGAVLSMPAVVPIETYPVMEKGDRIMLALRQRAETAAGIGDDDSW